MLYCSDSNPCLRRHSIGRQSVLDTAHLAEEIGIVREFSEWVGDDW